MSEQNTTTDAPKDAQEAPDTTAEQAPTPEPAGEQKDDQKDAPGDTPAGEPLDALGKLRKEAASHRVAAKEARTEADTLRSQLTAAQDTILAGELKRAGVTLDAFTAAGHRDSAFNADGTINTDALTSAIQDTAARYGSTRHIASDPTTGRENPPGGGGTPGWSALLSGL